MLLFLVVVVVAAFFNLIFFPELNNITVLKKYSIFIVCGLTHESIFAPQQSHIAIPILVYMEGNVLTAKVDTLVNASARTEGLIVKVYKHFDHIV